jgi:hypothetical protein
MESAEVLAPVGASQASFQLGLEDRVLRRQILVSKENLCLDMTTDERQNFRTFHCLHPFHQ